MTGIFKKVKELEWEYVVPLHEDNAKNGVVFLKEKYPEANITHYENNPWQNDVPRWTIKIIFKTLEDEALFVMRESK